MHLKRYRGTTVRDALAAARADLGPAALVLSTRLVPAHGLSGWLGQRVVEVTAALDRKVSETRTPEATTPTLDRRAAAPAAPSAADAIAALLAATGLDQVLAAEVDGRVPAPIEVFVGPPGAGKTTTIAKIAAQQRARRGARLGLVAADGFRVGAV